MATHFTLDRPASIERLMRLGIPALQGIHRELFGKNCPVPHVLYLHRKLAWELQARSQGGLPEEVRQHALNIAWQTTLRTRAPSQPFRPVSSTVSFGHDTRLPPPGTLLKRHFKGKPVLVKVLASGFEYDGRVFGSLSSVANEVAGGNWNGFVFFGLNTGSSVAARVQAYPAEQNPVKPAAIRCAIYTRKSTEEGLEQDFNTLDAQREAAQAFIESQRHEGWIALPKLYDDGGYTGANLDRPALKLLLADIATGEVNCVVVYKVDRLSRSLLDFSRIMDVLDRHGATFVAVTQQFNTTSSLGRLTLNILLSFAQFEREMISERTRDKMSAARKKGKWMGGTPVLGYDFASDGSGLVVNEQEAVQVCEIYRLYLDLGSPQRILAELEKRGGCLKAFTTRKGRNAGNAPFTRTTLHSLLTNPVYTGLVRHYGTTYPGEHTSIIDDRIWNEVQKRLNRDDRRGQAPHSGSLRRVVERHGPVRFLRCGHDAYVRAEERQTAVPLLCLRHSSPEGMGTV